MKRSLLLLIPALALATALCSGAEDAKKQPAKTGDHLTPTDAKVLNIGDAPPDFSLQGIDGKTHTLADYKDAKILVIAFLSNHCPDSQAVESRVKQFVSDMKDKG